MDETIRKLATAILTYYVDADKASRLATKLEEFLKSPQWQSYLESQNTQRLIWFLNAIITTETDDGHFSINMNIIPAATSNITTAGNAFIERFTPHYIRIRELLDMRSEEVRADCIAAFAQVQEPLIIDLRECPGGSPETAYFILSHLFPDGTPLFTLEMRSKPPQTFNAASTLPFYATYNKIRKYSGRLSLIVNGSTASAAEAIAFVIKNLNRGRIYGARTSSRAHINLILQIDNISARMPFAKMVDVKTGQDWEGVGIAPDYEVGSKEFIDFTYTELADNYLIPGVTGSAQTHRKPYPSAPKRAPNSRPKSINPFATRVPQADVANWSI